MDTEYIVDEHEMKVSIDDLNRASQSRAELAIESRKGLAEYSDKILLYSAGAFSFQITLLQFVSDKHVLARAGLFGIPNIYLMYASMFLYLLTAGLILVAKKLDTFYLSSNSGENYREKLLKELEAKLLFAEKYPSQNIVQGGLKVQVATYRSDIKKVKDVINKNHFSSAFYLGCVRFSRTGSEVTVFLATVFLFSFAVQLAQSLVW